MFLFGSHVDDKRRGCDIDLLIETPQSLRPAEQVERRTRFAARIWRELDEQRFDVVSTSGDEPDQRTVVAEVKQLGILLGRK